MKFCHGARIMANLTELVLVGCTSIAVTNKCGHMMCPCAMRKCTGRQLLLHMLSQPSPADSSVLI